MSMVETEEKHKFGFNNLTNYLISITPPSKI